MWLSLFNAKHLDSSSNGMTKDIILKKLNVKLKGETVLLEEALWKERQVQIEML